MANQMGTGGKEGYYISTQESTDSSVQSRVINNNLELTLPLRFKVVRMVLPVGVP